MTKRFENFQVKIQAVMKILTSIYCEDGELGLLLSDFEIAIFANVTLKKSIHEQNFAEICTVFISYSFLIF